MNKVTTTTLQAMKKASDKIVVLTGYDCPMAKMLNDAGIDVILVGDSMGMVKLGFDSTLPVTLEDILYHCKSVRRGNTRAMLVADMPFMSYEVSEDEAIANAGKLVKFGGAEGVKIEGGMEIVGTIKALINAKIPVMGHIGLTPQSINMIGGFRVQGKDDLAAKNLLETAVALENAGVFAIVLECVPERLAAEITQTVKIPTIGIGAGAHCDGQVLVTDDMLGLFVEFKPKFVKRYAELRLLILNALKQYALEVKKGEFPGVENTYK
ncbi:MAG: 3-methyl-2-oxobutanoate hydroxymethyltransferase [Endomicrobiales bacterium]|jgi:3-methyl-2-oxobutanoate hydroxymethyltransferase